LVTGLDRLVCQQTVDARQTNLRGNLWTHTSSGYSIVSTADHRRTWKTSVAQVKNEAIANCSDARTQFQ